ncbi:hypothetical protein RRG08_028069 [Elysia crispata]|uniref:Uncharacterized protein n=1 Tax=Elysia crispata TaxID=231223 RepID=A0AAE1A7A0_9GAST|nr:hypothetical protein RRG08_028069 [Elysia crispata]
MHALNNKLVKNHHWPTGALSSTLGVREKLISQSGTCRDIYIIYTSHKWKDYCGKNCPTDSPVHNTVYDRFPEQNYIDTSNQATFGQMSNSPGSTGIAIIKRYRWLSGLSRST